MARIEAESNYYDQFKISGLRPGIGRNDERHEKSLQRNLKGFTVGNEQHDSEGFEVNTLC